jgi:hypothetical protein
MIFLYIDNIEDMDDSHINDIRYANMFKGITFSNFKKTDAKNELLNSLTNSKIEQACYWSAELICAGHYFDLWETILFFYTKYIHVGNAKIAIYLELRIQNFKQIVNNGYRDDELRMRNNSKIRRLFCEVMCILCDAKKKHSFDVIKIKKEDFDITQLRDRFKAPSNKFIEETFKPDDPKELFPALNEIAYNVSEDVRNIINACYWVEWLMEFEAICKSKREKIYCERRNFAQVDTKSQKQIIWIVWDFFFLEAKKRSKFVQKIMDALFTLFTLKYSAGCERKRRNILYFAISVLCENNLQNEEIIRSCQQEIVGNILSKIDLIYKQIKKNEISPGTEYMFKDAKASNLEKTIEKLDKMNTFGETFVPRL